jgi:autotransporter adhesin
VALGALSVASGLNSIAVGSGSQASGANSIALGFSSQATGLSGTALGGGSSAGGEQSAALGFASGASGIKGLALGANSSATAANSVALGAGSVAGQADTVSVGNAGTAYQRRITNLAPGRADSDAATVGQLNSSEQQTLSQARDFAKTQAQSIGAVSAATANAAMATAGMPGRNRVALGVGNVGGQVGLGLAYSVSFGHWSATLSGGSNGSSDYSQFGGGAGFSW